MLSGWGRGPHKEEVCRDASMALPGAQGPFLGCGEHWTTETFPRAGRKAWQEWGGRCRAVLRTLRHPRGLPELGPFEVKQGPHDGR